MRAKGFLLQDDGSWKQTEVAGPPSFQAWSACWDVYRTILLMLRHNPATPGGDRKPVITWAALDEYFRTIATLNRQNPECWRLILQAEDRCRSDHLERIRRSLTRASIEARLPGSHFRCSTALDWCFHLRCKGSNVLESRSADPSTGLHSPAGWTTNEQAGGGRCEHDRC